MIVNPYDIEQFAEALRAGIEMDAAERRARMQRLSRQVEEHNIYRWAANFLTELAATALLRAPDGGRQQDGDGMAGVRRWNSVPLHVYGMAVDSPDRTAPFGARQAAALECSAGGHLAGAIGLMHKPRRPFPAMNPTACGCKSLCKRSSGRRLPPNKEKP